MVTRFEIADLANVEINTAIKSVGNFHTDAIILYPRTCARA